MSRVKLKIYLTSIFDHVGGEVDILMIMRFLRYIILC